MKEYFFNISDKVINSLSKDEHLTISINGEDSEFIRINNAKVRQLGTVTDASVGMELIKNNRKIEMSFTIRRNMEEDFVILRVVRTRCPGAGRATAAGNASEGVSITADWWSWSSCMQCGT